MAAIHSLARKFLSAFLISSLFFIPCALSEPLPVDQARSKESETALDRQCIASSAQSLLDASFNFNSPSKKDFPIELPVQAYRIEAYAADKTLSSPSVSLAPDVKSAPEGGRIVLKLLRPSDSISPENWQKSYLVGVSITNRNGRTGVAGKIELVSMPVVQKDAQTIIVNAYLPHRINGLFSEDWTVIPIVCGGNDNKLLGYASAKVTIVSSSVAWALAIAGMLLFWAIISYAAWQLNEPKLQALWEQYDGIWKRHSRQRVIEPIWKAMEAANPVFISQDSLGYGSLARFQILIFTSCVGLVLLYIFIHSGVISDVSSTVLLLLGVTVAGGTLARATGDWLGISTATRQWLLGTEVLKTRTDKPRWSDLFETQGEIDVAKVQALLFTSLISVGILASGLTGLSSFTLPDQIVYLSLISQGTYVFGKFLPADSRKKVEEDLQTLRDSARNVAKTPDDPTLEKQFEMAREAARRTLSLTYVNRFDGAKFDEKTSDPRLLA